MASYPKELEETYTDYGATEEYICDREFLKSSERLIEINRNVRSYAHWPTATGQWPNHLWVVGDDQCGNYYAIDTTRPEAPAYYFDHGDGTFEEFSKDVREFSDWAIESALDFNSMYDERA